MIKILKEIKTSSIGNSQWVAYTDIIYLNASYCCLKS